MPNSDSPIQVNGRDYPYPQQPVVVICLDGCEPAYLEQASLAGATRNLDRIRASGTDQLAHCVVPSFTNPNNLSIVTGCAPAVHGICGNFLIDPDSGEAVMMNDPRFLRVPTLFAAFQHAGAKIAIVTAKDKLRRLLGHGLSIGAERAICFSSECAASTTRDGHGLDNAAEWLEREVPDVYSAELSEFVFAAGVKLLNEFKPEILYLTTTDYVQHKHTPEEPEAVAFYAMFDRYLGQLDAAGAIVVITADHGMKPKHRADGTPDVIFLQDIVDQWLGGGVARVILPITDPYVVHHGALGSFATIYLDDKRMVAETIKRLAQLDGIELVIDRQAAAERFELPADRIGDIVVIGTENKALGSAESEHDLSGLTRPLRSHGGLSEQTVPFIVNRAIGALPSAPALRNFDAFFYAMRANRPVSP